MSTRSFKFNFHLALLGCATLLSILLTSLQFNLLEHNLYDLRVRISPPHHHPTNYKITLIHLDDATLKALGESSPLPLELHANFLEKIEKLKPRAVGYLINFPDLTSKTPTLSERRFVHAANRMVYQNIPFLISSELSTQGEKLQPYPLSSLPTAIATLDIEGLNPSEDRVIRRALLSHQKKLSFHAELAKEIKGKSLNPKGAYEITNIDSKFFYFRYHGNPIHHTSFESISFQDVLTDSPRAVPAISNAIVLVGKTSLADISDYTLTPYSREPYQSSKLAVHGEIISSILNEDSIQKIPSWLEFIFCFLAILSVFYCVLKLKPLQGFLTTLGLILGILIIGWVLYFSMGLWLTQSHPLIGVFLGYYLIVPYRLVLEYKKRWSAEKQNDALKQVEELKTNFLSLVTHDLKTPVAKIQALAERLKRKISDKIHHTELENLNHIYQSTEELNHFISSLLELHRIESHHVTLKIESKDINRLIEKSIELLTPQIQAKHIKIELDLEPLFPIQLDASLILKVLINLIDNAIKYSPDSSLISIHSHEKDKHYIQISITDQGIGLSPTEISNLFTRFFRGQNPQIKNISGTGVGLYLSKYFVEAHQGQIIVTSTPNLGSTFTIILPNTQSNISTGLTKNLDFKKNKIKEKNHV